MLTPNRNLDEALLLQSFLSTTASHAASSSDLRDIQRWLFWTSKGNQFSLLGDDREIWGTVSKDTEHKGDLIALQTLQHDERLARWLVHQATRVVRVVKVLWRRLLRLLKRESCHKFILTHPFGYSRRKV